MDCTFRRLGKIRLLKLNIELVYILTPITPNQRFWVGDEDGLPPEHRNIMRDKRPSTTLADGWLQTCEV